MIDPEIIIAKYYGDNSVLRDILQTHSRAVALHALDCLDAHPEIKADRRFVYEAAMLHDIGILFTDAPSIHCHGKAHYLCHGVLGGELLRHEGLPRHARVAERHTGTGLTVAEIVTRGLPLPHRDLLPETIEEQLVCYADKFYSKSLREGMDIRQSLMERKSMERVVHSLEKFGREGVDKFMRWHRMFGF